MSGGADMTFYPWLTLLPFAILAKIGVPPVIVMWLIPFLSILLSENLSLYGYIRCYGDEMHGALFAILYGSSQNVLDNVICQGDVGETLAMPFIPLVIFGWLRIMHGHKSLMLPVGIILIVFSHVPTTILLIVGLTFLTAISFTKLDKAKIKTFSIYGVVVILTTMAYWLPVMILEKANPIWLPELKKPLVSNADIALSPRPLIISQFTLWNFADVIGLILVMINWKKLSYFAKRLATLGCGCLIFNMPYLPWTFLQDHTIIRNMQFPFRVNFFVEIIFSLLLIRIIRLHWNKKSISKTSRMATCITLIIIGIATTLMLVCEPRVATAQKNHIHVNLNDPLGSIKIYSHGKEKSKFLSDKEYDALTNKDLQDHRMLKTMTHFDYEPKTFTKSILSRYHKHDTKDNDKKEHYNKSVYMHSYPNHLYLREPVNSAHMSLPFVTYRGQNYKFFVNSKQVKPAGYLNGQPYLNHVHKGTYRITYQTPLAWYRYVAIISSLIGILWLSELYVKNRKM